MRKAVVVLALVLAAPLAGVADWAPQQAPLMTRWSKDVTPANVLSEYPRPQLVRNDWLNLNGVWQFQPALGNEPVPAGHDLSGTILVPFPIQSALSGVMKPITRAWYRRSFEVPSGWSNRHLILHFDAVDWEAEIFVNGASVGVHQGGYDPFSFDITPYLKGVGPQELIVRIDEPLNTRGVPRGKQTSHPEGFMYTASSGIWQTVWLEPVDPAGIRELRLIPDVDGSRLRLTAATDPAANGLSVSVKMFDGGRQVQAALGVPNQEMSIPLNQPKLWSPDSPFLYDVDVTVTRNSVPIDEATSYFGMRKIALGRVDGVVRPLLNGKFVFQMGPLDQGFWSDGLYTAPTDEALRYDLEQIKAMGFNMVRCHIKVERPRWYYWADKLGLMVWQDMPCPNSYMDSRETVPPVDAPQFELELRRMVQTHWNHPSIVMWDVFNEGEGEATAPSGVGQQSTAALVNIVRNLDPTRLINEASGGLHVGAGDVLDAHSYPEPPLPVSRTQMTAVGEYGGIALKVDGHMWSPGHYFGNIRVKDAAELASVYDTFGTQLLAFKSLHGLSAAVYTQITDVEKECNGLMTYDRLLKPDPAKIRATNQRVIDGSLSLTPVVPTSEKQRQIWKFTKVRPPGNWAAPDFDDSSWTSAPGGFGSGGTPGAVVGTKWTDTPGEIWLRRDFNPGPLSATERSSLVFSCYHDEGCEIYLNGVLAAKDPSTATCYVVLPMTDPGRQALLPNARNVLAVHCVQTVGGQFIDAGLYQMTR